jgi:catalase
VLFDAVAIIASADGARLLEGDASAIDWIRDAYGHLKVIGATAASNPLLDRAGAVPDAGVVTIEHAKDVPRFITAAKHGRIWDRETRIRPPV